MTRKNIIIISLAVLAVVGVLAFWYYRETIFSKEILKLEILGPETAKVGDQVTYTVQYKNNGNFALQQPKLTFEIPDDSLTEDGKTRLTQTLEDIYPGQQEKVQFKARLLGKEGDVKTVHAWLSYIPKNLSVRYESDTTFSTKIETVPVTLTFDLPSKVEKGKEITYDINYFSNVDYPLENLSIKISTPAGFNVQSSTPTSLDNVEWKLATLTKAQGGRITITGLMGADPGSSATFAAQLGMWQNGDFVVIQEASQDAQVINSLVSISQQINNATDYVASPGDSLHYQVFVKNTGTTGIDNVSTSATLSSSAFDLSSLTSQDGSVRLQNGSITWDPKTVYKLQHLDAGEQVSVSFDVKLKDSWASSDDQKNNLLIKNTVQAAGVVQEFSNKINSNLQLTQKAYYSTQQDLQNTGPIPPEVNTPTSYIITWQIKNYFNDVKNVKVRATLPAGITLTTVSPDSAIPQFSYDNTSRQMVWSVGNVSAGAGVNSSAPIILIQISLTPGSWQKGILADLVGQATITGEDQSTGKTISSFAPGVKTDLPDDQASSGGGIVQ